MLVPDVDRLFALRPWPSPHCGGRKHFDDPFQVQERIVEELLGAGRAGTGAPAEAGESPEAGLHPLAGESPEAGLPALDGVSAEAGLPPLAGVSPEAGLPPLAGSQPRPE